VILRRIIKGLVSRGEGANQKLKVEDVELNIVSELNRTVENDFLHK
jgi:hypothetical protein